MQFIRLTLIVMLGLPYYASAIIYRYDMPLARFQDLAKEQSFDAVGMVCDTTKGLRRLKGSCVLIADRYVLTAKHILKIDTAFDAAAYRIIFNEQHYQIAAIHPYAEKDHDLMLIELVDSVKGVRPLDMCIKNPAVGDTLTMVGYGALRPSNMMSGNVGIGIRTAAQNILDSLGDMQSDGSALHLYSDFYARDTQRFRSLPLEGMLNGGDSGGGLFVKEKDVFKLVGIASGSKVVLSSDKGFDGSTMSWCNVATYRKWIISTIKSSSKLD